MAKKILKYFQYSHSELAKYVKDTKSSVQLVNSEMHIGFPPWGLNNFQETLTNMVKEKKIGLYDNNLRGVVLDVKNIKVLGNQFPIHNDSPYLHINLLVDFYIFAPKVGNVIKGIIKHIAPAHISVTVYRVFNISIKLQYTSRRNLKINSEIFVKITNFDLEHSIPFIEGALIKDYNKMSVDLESGIGSGISNSSIEHKQTDSSSSSSESEDENNEKTINHLIKIKQERFSQSPSHSLSKKNATKRKASESSDTSDSDDSTRKVPPIKIKTEKYSSTETEESSSSDEETPMNDLLTSLQENILTKIQQELKQQDTKVKQEKPSKNSFRKITPKREPTEIANESQFSSPMLSSTLKSTRRIKKTKAKEK